MDVKGPVRIVFGEADGGFVRTGGTRLYCADGEIHAVSHLQISVQPDDLVRATVELIPNIETINGASFTATMKHPETGLMGDVSRVIFADGSEVNFLCKS